MGVRNEVNVSRVAFTGMRKHSGSVKVMTWVLPLESPTLRNPSELSYWVAAFSERASSWGDGPVQVARFP